MASQSDRGRAGRPYFSPFWFLIAGALSFSITGLAGTIEPGAMALLAIGLTLATVVWGMLSVGISRIFADLIPTAAKQASPEEMKGLSAADARAAMEALTVNQAPAIRVLSQALETAIATASSPAGFFVLGGARGEGRIDLALGIAEAYRPSTAAQQNFLLLDAAGDKDARAYRDQIAEFVRARGGEGTLIIDNFSDDTNKCRQYASYKQLIDEALDDQRVAGEAADKLVLVVCFEGRSDEIDVAYESATAPADSTPEEEDRLRHEAGCRILEVQPCLARYIRAADAIAVSRAVPALAVAEALSGAIKQSIGDYWPGAHASSIDGEVLYALVSAFAREEPRDVFRFIERVYHAVGSRAVELSNGQSKRQRRIGVRVSWRIRSSADKKQALSLDNITLTASREPADHV